ncbi:Glutamine-rich protein 23 [Heracleum sosnowskyi]|uniref:Glutamine-rich protein 23 n=1 Tax=Heracleum sosnowskyi TaxID=360622 RepID=A0AAD8H653_9APIA|nr:Glutamine-rich protein 23 [Heracleum sosnowskyi]
MSFYRLLLRSLTRTTPTLPHHPTLLIPLRTFAFSSAEEAAAERRRRKRRLRIEPPLHALRRDPNAPRPTRDPNAPRLPDSTSALVGPRLSLHNRVQALIRANDLDNASIVARQSVFSNTRPTVFTCNAIIASMHRAKRYEDAVALFAYFFNQSNIVPNVVSYNFLMNAHCDMGNVDVALDVYRHIIANAPFSPSSVSYRHLTKGLIDAGRIGDALDLLREMLNKGHGADSLVYNNLISGFLNLGDLDKANELFDELKERCLVYDGIVSSTFMDWYFKQGKEKEAMDAYKYLLSREFRMVPATCNVLLEVLLRYGRKAEAEALFDKMLDDHTPPTVQAVNSDTFNIMVNECFKEGKIAEAYDVFKKVGKGAKSKPFMMDVGGSNNMIMRYCEHDMVDDAEKVYLELCGRSLNPDVTTYRTLIDAYFKVGRVDSALEKYVKMVDVGLRVIPPYANGWFSLLIENGKVMECVPILSKMAEKEPRPDVTSYDIVIRALTEQGNLDAVLELVGQMCRYNIGITSPLGQFLSETFGKVQNCRTLCFTHHFWNLYVLVEVISIGNNGDSLTEFGGLNELFVCVVEK